MIKKGRQISAANSEAMKNRGMNTTPASSRGGVNRGQIMSNGGVGGGAAGSDIRLKRNFSETGHDFGIQRAAGKMMNPRMPSCPKTGLTAARSDSFTGVGGSGGATELHRTESDSYSFRPIMSANKQEADQQSAGALSSALKLTLQKSDINFIKEILKKKDKNAISEIAAANRTRSPSKTKNASNLSKIIFQYFYKN